MALEPTAPRSRRALLGAVVAAAAAAAAAAMPASVAAADPNDVVLGADNTTTARTKITSSVAGGFLSGNAAIAGVNTAAGGVGVLGLNNAAGGIGVDAEAELGTAVAAWGSHAGVSASSLGRGLLGTGVDISSVGVHGYVSDAGVINVEPVVTQTGVGVLAEAGNDTLTALHVLGRVRFNRAGKASMSATQTSKVITKAGVTTSSYVIATLQTPVAGVFVRAVKPEAGKFTIYLSKAAGKTVYIGYLVIN